ncbi:MAG: arginine biosynthesis bifunctional protein ArgJ [Chloroflexi bacterium OLB15]|nr:MAG: arginine biosynthesis bifunctional protein ArgJ [Chloroflexi bacterium OLB15]
MASVSGFSVSGVHAGLKANDALDMAVIFSDRPCVAAGVFTTNLMKAAPVLFDIGQLTSNSDNIRAIVVNTKCANACTGEQGLANARETARLAAKALGIESSQVLVMSTGVIGTHLPMPKIARGIELATATLGQDWDAAARGIMTTDTRPKLASESFDTPNGKVTLTGIAKGAGMIAPNMATLLSAVVTDAVLTAEQAYRLLKQAVEPTFNRIVVDGDMSTNDTLMLLANGASGVSISPNFEAQFAAALLKVCRELAQAIVRDGEGATKFITLHVKGAVDDAAARQIANAIATSPLVKTAFYGGDANWGRIVAAAGRSGVSFDAASVKLRIAKGETLTGDLLLFENEMPTQYSEERATEIVKSSEVYALLDVGQGAGEAIVYTCDLSHDYVSINGSYRS